MTTAVASFHRFVIARLEAVVGPVLHGAQSGRLRSCSLKLSDTFTTVESRLVRHFFGIPCQCSLVVPHVPVQAVLATVLRGAQWLGLCKIACCGAL